MTIFNPANQMKLFSKSFRILFCIFSLIVASTLCVAQSGDVLHQPRVWTSQSGKTVEARFLRLDNGWVYLQHKQNKEISIKLSNLSESDQELVGRYWVTNGYSLEALEENLRLSLPVKPTRDPQGNLIIAHEGIYSGWLYATVTNYTLDHGLVKTDVAFLVSNNAVPLSKKKDEWTFLILCLAHRPHVGNMILLLLSNDRSPKSDTSVLVGFDEKPPFWIGYKPIKKSDVFFLENSKKFVSELKKSKSFTINVKVPGDNDTRQTFSFNAFDLQWKH